jgi:hypothetical protein
VSNITPSCFRPLQWPWNREYTRCSYRLYHVEHMTQYMVRTIFVIVHLVEARHTCEAMPLSRTIAAHEYRASLLASAGGANLCNRPRLHPSARGSRNGVGERPPASRGDGPAVDGAVAPRLTHLLAARRAGVSTTIRPPIRLNRSP